MARGLSDLQKWMLLRALENADSDLCRTVVRAAIPGYLDARTFNPVHLTRSEIRADYYKFIPGELSWGIWEAAAHPVDREWLRDKAAFMKSQHPNYAAVNLAITRAHHRLSHRGLATNQVGFWLTDKDVIRRGYWQRLARRPAAGAANRV